MTETFDGLPLMSFDLIAADPPWSFDLRSDAGDAKSAQAQYDTMPIEDIEALPVATLAQRDCVLLLWTSAPRLDLAMRLIPKWGFIYKSTMAWRKTTPSGKVRMGTGYWCRSMHEVILLATIGCPTKISAFPSLFDGVAREHSRKPEEFYALVEKHSAGVRRLDLFSRQSRPGWTSWGREATKFDAL